MHIKIVLFLLIPLALSQCKSWEPEMDEYSFNIADDIINIIKNKDPNNIK
jgi:hypothetical protein